MDQQYQSGRVVRVPSGAAPSAGTAPHVTLSPRTPWGGETAGFRFGLSAPALGSAATPGAGDFTVTIYARDAGTGAWYALDPKTGIALGALYSTFDLSGPSDLFFGVGNVGASGDVFVMVLEQ